MDGKDLPINGEYAKLYFKENAEKKAEKKPLNPLNMYMSETVSEYFDNIEIKTQKPQDRKEIKQPPKYEEPGMWETIKTCAKGAYEGITEWDRKQTERIVNAWSNSDIGALARGDFKTFWEIQKNSSAGELVKGNFKEAAVKLGEENKNLSTALGFETAKDGYREVYKEVEKSVDDGDDTKLSAAERAVSIVGGVGDVADDWTSPLGLASLPVFGAAIKGGNWVLSKLPSFIGKTVSTGLVADGSRRVGNGLYDIAASDTKEEVKEGVGTVVGGAIETGIGFGAAAAIPKNVEMDALSQKLKADPKTKDLAKLVKGDKTTQENLTQIKREVAKIYRPDVTDENKAVFQEINGMIENAKKSIKAPKETKPFGQQVKESATKLKDKVKGLFKKETKPATTEQGLLEYKPAEEAVIPKETTVKPAVEKTVEIKAAEVKPVEVAKPKGAETPYAEAAVADVKAVVENAKSATVPVEGVKAPEVKHTESKTEVAKAEPKAEIAKEFVTEKPLPKTKEELKVWLESLTEGENPVFYVSEVNKMLKYIDDSNIDLVEKFIKTSLKNKNISTLDLEVPDLCSLINDKNKTYIEKLIDKKTRDGKPRFEGFYDFEKIIWNLDSQNEFFLNELIDMTTKDGKPLLCGDDIGSILKIINSDNKSYIYKLLNRTTKDGKPRLKGEDIAYIAEVVNSNNESYINELINMTTASGKPRLIGKDIANIVKVANFYNKNYINELLNITTKDGKPRLNGKDIVNIVKVANFYNKNYINELIGLTTKDGKLLLDGEDIANIVRAGIDNKNKIYIEKLTSMLKEGENSCIDNQTFKDIMQLINFGRNGIQDIPYSRKSEIVKSLEEKMKTIEASPFKIRLQEKLSLLKKSMNSSIEPIPVSQKANNEFWKGFLTTADKGNAVVIKGLDSVVEKHCKKDSQGLPLEFSRADFVKELKAKLETLPEEQRTEILKKLDIQLNDNSYEGFINLKGLDSTVTEEAKIQKLCERFLLENRINTGDPQTDKFINSIIKGMPEFVNIIGKKQHGTHVYTLDGHTLKVLKEVVSNPKFETLSNQDKVISQLMALFHDIGKQEGVVDAGHEFTSSVMANDILSKINLPEFTKKRIVELIKNHNWLQQVSTGEITPETAAVMFRNPEDVKIAEIFAEADLKGVENGFFELYSYKIKPNVEKIRNSLNDFYSTGNMIFPTRILNGDKIPAVEFNGQKYRFLDVSKLPEGTDLSEFGLSVKDKKDLRLIFHAGNFEKMESLTKPFNESVICATMISPTQKEIFIGSDKVGILLDAPNSNVINSSPCSQRSGVKRNFKNAVSMYNDSNLFRTFQKDVFLKFLSAKYPITENEYTEIYRHLIDKKHLSQIQDIILSNGTTIKAEDLRNAYKTVEDEIMKYTSSEINEINLYNPQVKGAILIGESLSEIPAETLQFIKEHNLPIFIMGRK